MIIKHAMACHHWLGQGQSDGCSWKKWKPLQNDFDFFFYFHTSQNPFLSFSQEADLLSSWANTLLIQRISGLPVFIAGGSWPHFFFTDYTIFTCLPKFVMIEETKLRFESFDKFNGLLDIYEQSNHERIYTKTCPSISETQIIITHYEVTPPPLLPSTR